MVAWFILTGLVSGLGGAVGGVLIERLRVRGQLIRDAMDYSWRIVEAEQKPKDFIGVFQDLKRLVLDC